MLRELSAARERGDAVAAAAAVHISAPLDGVRDDSAGARNPVEHVDRGGSCGWRAVAAGGLQALVAAELGGEHEVVARANESGDAPSGGGRALKTRYPPLSSLRSGWNSLRLGAGAMTPTRVWTSTRSRASACWGLSAPGVCNGCGNSAERSCTSTRPRPPSRSTKPARIISAEFVPFYDAYRDWIARAFNPQPPQRT